LGYIYRGEGNVGRLTLFHSNLNDVFVLEGTKWSNSGGAQLIGAELELEQSLFSKLKLDGNISYTHTEDEETGEALPATANWLANFGISYNPLRNLVFNAQYRYVGEQNRAPEDTRENLKAFHTIDVTGTLFNLFFKGLTFRTGVKNIFDEDVRYAAPANTYPEDYPQAGRRWWCEVSYEF
jgi:iron complex outermembrane receptor protein